MARTPNPRIQAIWRARVNRQVLSGLSVAEFCSKERCAKSAFYRWRRLVDLARPANQSSPPPIQPDFLPVTVRLVDRDAHQPAPIEADLPSGIRLRIPTANVRLACRLVRALAGAKASSGGSR
jgi:hypothetical protein